MKYALAVLTHGDNADVLERTIHSFDANVSPPPVWRCLYQDGLCTVPPLEPHQWVSINGLDRLGFCGATRRLWQMVARSDADFDFVFWLEHDFEFKRAVDIWPMALQLRADPTLAQMALMRGPVNEEERDAGGVVGKHEARGDVFRAEETESGHPFLRQWAYFTSNPSLMRREFMLEHPFPEHERECEGKFGIQLRTAGFDFAVWGDGSPWVTHIGTRTGHGY